MVEVSSQADELDALAYVRTVRGVKVGENRFRAEVAERACAISLKLLSRKGDAHVLNVDALEVVVEDGPARATARTSF